MSTHNIRFLWRNKKNTSVSLAQKKKTKKKQHLSRPMNCVESEGQNQPVYLYQVLLLESCRFIEAVKYTNCHSSGKERRWGYPLSNFSINLP